MQPATTDPERLLPDGRAFPIWERHAPSRRTYFVDARAQYADDEGAGTEEQPFRTIGRAAQVLQPGERVVIAEGVYRESIHPARGGTAPDRMISYEAAPSALVVVKGSIRLTEGWRPSAGWSLPAGAEEARIWSVRLDGGVLGGYNPFGMANVLHDRGCLPARQVDLRPFWRRRGMLFAGGVPLRQVDLYRELADGDGRFWVEHDGLTLHVRLPGDADPAERLVEAAVRERLFAPDEPGLGYIRVQGLTFEHAANGFPVPQRGAVSTYRGHHWIVEDCTVRWANAVGIDAGNECWNASQDREVGSHILRRNTVQDCGVCGIAGFLAPGLLVEENVIERCGWQDAEHGYEAAGLKLHLATDLLCRRNVFRHLDHACGVWLDCSNRNCRITGNTFADIASIMGAILVEGTHRANQVDGNIISGVRTRPALDGSPCGGHGIYAMGTDHLVVTSNIVAACEQAGFYADTVAGRLIDGRGGTARSHRLLTNLFVDCGQAAIAFANEHSSAEGNLYAGMPGGFLQIGTPEPRELLDLDAWQQYHGLDLRGRVVPVTLRVDPDALTMTIEVEGLPPAAGGLRDLDVAALVTRISRATRPA